MKTLVATFSIEKAEEEKANRYKFRTRILIDSTLKFTPHDVLVVTNAVSYFSDYADNKRVIIIDFDKEYKDEPLVSGGVFNFNLKRLPIKSCIGLNYDYILYQDCDCFFSGWDQEAFEDMMSLDYDVYYATFYPHHTVQDQLDKPKNHPSTGTKIEALKEIMHDDLYNAVIPVETKIIYKNSIKIEFMIDMWDKFAALSEEKKINTYPESVYIAMAAQHAKMKPIGVDRNHPLGPLCMTMHGCSCELEAGVETPIKILDYFGLVQFRLDNEEQVRERFNLDQPEIETTPKQAAPLTS